MVVLVCCAAICHSIVLYGNFLTAGAFKTIGQSTKQWSSVGLQLAVALEGELEVAMAKASDDMLESLKKINAVQKTIDATLTVVGSTTEEAMNKTGVALLQFGRGVNDSAFAPMVLEVVYNLAEKALAHLQTELKALFMKLLPLLEQVGQWVTQFGDQVQAFVLKFATSLDRIQKIFDQIMGSLNGKGDNYAQLWDQTQRLFFISGGDSMTPSDLRKVAYAYSIPSLQGELVDTLITKYDSSGDGSIQLEELELLVTDPSVEGLMAKILRQYSKELATIAGQVSAAGMRQEMTAAVINYLALACSNNQTKVNWVSDRLTNRSLPKAMSSDILVGLCYFAVDPTSKASIDIGATVIEAMYSLHSDYLMELLHNVATNSTFWISEGWNIQDQPECTARISGWITRAEVAVRNASNASIGLTQANTMLSARAKFTKMSEEQLSAYPSLMRAKAQVSMLEYKHKRRQEHDTRKNTLYQTATAVHLRAKLLAGDDASSSGPVSSGAEKALNRGVHCAPVTLEFAHWLSNNATESAGLMQSICFTYTGQSSDIMDSYGDKIQSLAKTAQAAIAMLQTYSTPAGIAKLKSSFDNFVDNALPELMEAVEEKIGDVVTREIPKVVEAIENATYEVGHSFGIAIADKLAGPLGASLEPAIASIASEFFNDSTLGQQIGGNFADVISQVVSNSSREQLGDMVGKYAQEILDSVMSNLATHVTDGKLSDASLLQISSLSSRLHDQVSLRRQRTHMLTQTLHSNADELDLALSFQEKFSTSPAWSGMVLQLRELFNVLPLAANAVTFAKKEVFALHKNLHNAFAQLKTKGPTIFETAATTWKIVWILMYCLFVPLTVSLLFYAFWASGYFGGPQPLEGEDEPSPPATIMDKVKVCFHCCCTCFSRCHDKEFFFWSIIVLLQVICLLLFVLAIGLCIVSGVQVLLVSGCMEVYILSDGNVCDSMLLQIREFLKTFHIGKPGETFEGMCTQKGLNTCSTIEQSTKSAAFYTTVFSFLATLFSLQILVESATMHEMAKWRRLLHKKL